MEINLKLKLKDTTQLLKFSSTGYYLSIKIVLKRYVFLYGAEFFSDKNTGCFFANYFY
jgi:hypothetical protein